MFTRIKVELVSSVDDNVKIELSQAQKQILLTNLNKYDKLECIKAFEVARLIGKKPKEMSAITKSLGIKITNCELGVFGEIEFDTFNKLIYDELLKKYKNKKIECKTLWKEAKDSGLRKIGSAVKNSDIEVVYCQLGCFRRKKGKGNES